MEPTSLNLMANVQEEGEGYHLDTFGLVIIGTQLAIVILFFVFCRFTQPDGTPYGTVTNVTARSGGTANPNDVIVYWQFLRDVAVMIFIGFGYLMTFLKRHRFSAIGWCPKIFPYSLFL